MKRLILDVDTGIDDALAITMVLGMKNVSLEGVTVAFGNTYLDYAVRNSLDVLYQLHHPEIGVYQGAFCPWGRDDWPVSDHLKVIHGKNGVGDVAFSHSPQQPRDKKAWDFMIEAAEKYGKDLIIVNLGPLTNLANAIKKNKEAMSRCGTIAIMGGALTVRGNITPYAEANIYNDPAAAKYVMDSGLDLTMIGLDNLVSGEYQNNGLCLIYRLEDGSFVIVDGGHSEDAAISATDIVNALREQSKDYAKSDSDIRIAAWIITHPHSDHFGTFVKAYSQFTKFKVERVFANFWDSVTFEAFKSAKDTFAPGKYTTYSQTPTIAAKLGAKYIVPHVGQVWWIGGTRFEFLYTLESFLPRTTPTFNTCSLIFRTVTTDKSGKDYTVMVTGDATGYTMQIIADTFGKALKCDVVQLAHHGSITSGNNGGTQKAYELMSPSVLLWPVGDQHYSTVKEYTYNHVLYDSRNPNFAELYIAGWQGNTVTISLPYTLGTAERKIVVEP